MATLIDILQQYWGYPAFRPLQEDIIQTAMHQQDCLALLPTGGGKSLCFQVPALAQEGICIVVSPLIALMKDQVQQLQARGIKAEAIYSGMRYQDIDRIVDNAVYGQLKFLYCSPERLKTDIFQQRLPKMSVNLIAVDEAHCISQWGYDFRPAYLEIAQLRELLPKVPIMALTATATPEVVLDIQEKLLFQKDSQIWKKSFVRDNLAYVVRPAEGKMSQLVDILQKVAGSAVVYVRNRRRCKEIAIELNRRNIPASFYHAGVDMDTRSARQEAWIAGTARVMVATNAFGMGIDKADVRVVVHLDLPDSLEAYFQEAGRAGRDGEKAFAVLLFSRDDKDRLQRNYKLSFPSVEKIRQVYRALGSHLQLATGAGMGQSFDFDIAKFAKTYQLDAIQSYHCLKVLEQSGWLMLSESIFLPAGLQIRVNKDQLYDYQLKNPKLDRILKIILRSYQGAFSHSVNLKEKQLASFLKISIKELRQSLHRMHKDDILWYRPVKDQPQLFFLRERVSTELLSIDLPAYRFRKERQLARIKAAIRYVEVDSCRSRQLIEYFGEQKTQNCGVCDVCLARKKQGLNTSQHQQYRHKIQEALLAKAQPADVLIALFSSAEENLVISSLSYLLDEGLVEKRADGNLTWTG